MRRFVTLAALLLFTIPFGVSISGCSKTVSVTYCNGGDTGLATGQLTTLTLQPRLTGISLNYGEIGQSNTPSGEDCKGNTVSVSAITYGTSNQSLVDIVPTTGRICAGSWNRNSGGGIANYTTCTAGTTSGTAYITATAQGVTSNAIAVYVHPIVTSILLGAPSTNCTSDPASNCTLDATQANGCVQGAAGATVTVGIANYTGSACVSQNQVVQLAARVYQGTDTSTAANNISCQVGPLTFTPQVATIASVNQNSQATALQPGSTVINAATSNSSSSAGFFSVCPPASISLTVPGQSSTSVAVNQNNSQSLTATVLDTAGNSLTNLSLEYVSTTPTTIPVAAGVVTPPFPGTAEITAICQPPSCNYSPFNQIGLFGNGTTITSNPVTVTATGTNSNVLYVGSTGSQYILPVDFTNTNTGSPVRLPFAPNSMVLSTDESTLYMGTTSELMIFSAASSTLTKEDTSVPGTVSSVSPDSTTIVISDTLHNLIYLYGSSGSISTEYGGQATRSAWTADSSTVYILTATNHLLVHSSFTGWSDTDLAAAATDVAVTVPNSGIFLGGATETARTNCPSSAVSGTAGSYTVANTFYPPSNPAPTVGADRLTITNSGAHVLGATTTQFSDVLITVPLGACPPPIAPAFTTPASPTFNPQTITTPALAGVTATSIVGVTPTSDSDFAFVSYIGTGGVVPQYNVAAATLSNITLSGSATAPVAEVISTDNTTLFVGTSGDNLVHLLTRGTSKFADSSSSTGITIPLNPLLPAITGSGYATPNLLAVRPRKLTN